MKYAVSHSLTSPPVNSKISQDRHNKKEQSLLNPEKVKTKEVIRQADEITSSDLSIQIQNLKVPIAQELSELAEKVASEAKKYTVIQEAIELKQAELEEIYGMKHAASLAAILESNNHVKEQFETEMTLRREKLQNEIQETRTTCENEKKNYRENLAEDQKIREKDRKREEDEYSYDLQRSRSLEENKLADTFAALEKEIEEKKEKIDKHVEEKTTLLNDREQQILQREKAMDALEKSVNSFPDELEVLETKISALKSLVNDQAKQIEKLNNQQEKAYQQVQDIATRAVTGATERPQAITVQTTEREGNSS